MKIFWSLWPEDPALMRISCWHGLAKPWKVVRLEFASVAMCLNKKSRRSSWSAWPMWSMAALASASAFTYAYVEVAQQFGHPVYAHCLDREGFRVSDFVTLAKSFPQVRFILGHGGIGPLDFPGIQEIAPVGNILYETSGAFK